MGYRTLLLREATGPSRLQRLHPLLQLLQPVEDPCNRWTVNRCLQPLQILPEGRHDDVRRRDLESRRRLQELGV